MAISVKVDTKAIEKALAQVPDELGRAVRNATNDTLRDTQKVIQDHVLQQYDVRQKRFILNTVKISKENRATTTKHSAMLEIDPQRDILAKFERGGPKVAIGGAKYVALPVSDIRTKGGHVKPQYALKKFKPFAEASGVRSLSLRGKARVRDMRPKLVGQKGTFFIRLRSGLPALMQRTARTNRLLYLFRPSVRIPATLRFEDIGRKTIVARWPVRAQEAIAHALRRAGLT